jgi:hypothetical protein
MLWQNNWTEKEFADSILRLLEVACRVIDRPGLLWRLLGERSLLWV